MLSVVAPGAFPSFFLRLSVFCSTLSTKHKHSHYPSKMMAFLFALTPGWFVVGDSLELGDAMSENNGRVYLTRERLVEIEQELKQLKTVGRAEMAQKIAEARGYGDLSENAEYDAAKEAQGLMELKISKLEETLSRARVIEGSDLPNDKVYILSHVKLKDTKTGEVLEYRLVAQEEADFEKNKISVTSPIGKGLIGKTAGETVKIKVPAGFLEYKILEISR
jgi:transcription elongation factor GreA